jgi:signal peptidase II
MAVPRSRYWVFALLAVGGALVDLATKSWAFAWLGMPSTRTWWIIDDFCGFTTSLNEGALFGVGQGQVALFTVLSLSAAVAIVYWLFVRGAACDWPQTIAMGAVTAGILGNLYDRVGLPGLEWNYPGPHHQLGEPVFAVRDWIHFKFGALGSWPIFNIADSLLVCGVGTLLWQSWRGGPAEDASRASPSDLSEPGSPKSLARDAAVEDAAGV